MNKQPTDVERILFAIKQRGLFNQLRRYDYTGGNYNVNDAMHIIQAIGQMRTPNFVIDDENRFAYENFIKWVHGDKSMQCINPETNQPTRGNLKRGIYIAGSTGTGKTWCLEIMLAYCAAYRFQILFPDDGDTPRPLWWETIRADELTEYYAQHGDITPYKNKPSLAIQDLGAEQTETLYMGNRMNVLQKLIQYRGDNNNMLTFATSNYKLNSKTIVGQYGERIQSRLFEMCNYLVIRGKDRRKG